MFKLFPRYLASNFIPPFILSTVFFVTFLLTFQLFRITRIVINKGVGPEKVLELMGHIAITFIPHALPLSCLFATIYALNKLSEDSEIVAMRSFGTSKLGLFYPFLIVGSFIALTVFSVNRELIPFSKGQFKNMVIKMTSKGMLNDIKPGNFYTDIPGVTLFAEKVFNEGKNLEEVFIRLNTEENEEKVIVAENGELIKIGEEEGQVPIIRLNLKNGTITKKFPKGDNMEKILFDEYDFPVFSENIRPGFVTKDSMKTMEELFAQIKAGKEKIKSMEKNPSTNEDELRNFKRNFSKTQIEFWGRVNNPFQCLLFIFLGFSLGIKSGRGKTRKNSLYGILTLILYYAIFFFDISLARKGNMDPALAIFLPGVVLLMLGIWFYSKLDWSN